MAPTMSGQSTNCWDASWKSRRTLPSEASSFTCVRSIKVRFPNQLCRREGAGVTSAKLLQGQAVHRPAVLHDQTVGLLSRGCEQSRDRDIPIIGAVDRRRDTLQQGRDQRSDGRIVIDDENGNAAESERGHTEGNLNVARVQLEPLERRRVWRVMRKPFDIDDFMTAVAECAAQREVQHASLTIGMVRSDRAEARRDFLLLCSLLQTVFAEIRELRAEVVATFGGSTEERVFGMELDRLEEKARSVAFTATAFLDMVDH
jgi:hypothetical protein